LILSVCAIRILLHSIFALTFFTFSSNVRRRTVPRSTDNFVYPACSFAFSNVNSRDVFIAIHQIGSNAIGLDVVPLKVIKKISSGHSSCFYAFK
jgi:hypothetical protein